MPWSGAPGLAAAAAIPIWWPMPSTRQVLAFGDFRFNLTTRELSLAKIDGPPIPVPLGSRATDLLYLFLQRPGDLVTKAEIMEAVWPNSVVEDSNLSVQISALRRILEEGRATSSIQTVAGRGYRFALPVTEAPDVQIADSEEFGSDPVKPDAAGSGASASGFARAGSAARWPLIAAAMLLALLGGAALVLFWQRFSASRVVETPDSCPNGLVWREATPGDHVCVTPKFRAMMRQKEVGPPPLQSPAANSAPLPSVGAQVEGIALYGSDYSYANS